MARFMIRNFISLSVLTLILLVVGHVATAATSKVQAKPAVATAREIVLDVKKDASKVTFLAVGQPSALKIEGTGDGATGQITLREASGKLLASGKLGLELDSLDTGIAMRTRHMKEKYLETGKYPKAELTIESMEIPQALAKGDGKAQAPFTGTLSLHGVQKPVTGTAELTRVAGTVAATSKFKIDLSQFAIAVPKFAGITVAKDVDVQVDLKAPVPADVAKGAK